MRLKQYLIESKTLYHVTHKANLFFIKKNGITNQKKPANTGAAGQDIRDDPNAIYAFNDKIEAYRWAFKMNWNMDPSQEVVVIEFKSDAKWEKDTHWQAQTAMKKGSWIRSRGSVSPKEIKKVISQKKVFDEIKRLNKAGKLN
jgi:hypothetical protein